MAEVLKFKKTRFRAIAEEVKRFDLREEYQPELTKIVNKFKLNK